MAAVESEMASTVCVAHLVSHLDQAATAVETILAKAKARLAAQEALLAEAKARVDAKKP